jgi:hypothetical protein
MFLGRDETMEKSINNEREDIENPKSAVITANIKQVKYANE